MEHWNISISSQWKLQASQQMGSCPETQSKDVWMHSSLSGLLVPRSSQSLCALFISPFHLSQANSVFTGTFTFKGNPEKLLGSSLLFLHTYSFNLDTFYVKTNHRKLSVLKYYFQSSKYYSSFFQNWSMMLDMRLQDIVIIIGSTFFSFIFLYWKWIFFLK